MRVMFMSCVVVQHWCAMGVTVGTCCNELAVLQPVLAESTFLGGACLLVELAEKLLCMTSDLDCSLGAYVFCKHMPYFA